VHAPNIFAFDDERNQAYVLAPNPPDSELADLRRAVANCPEHAIAVISDRRTTESELKR
jgi:ferredoxin